jgi:Protein of unknown function (DUF2384)
MGSVAAQGVRLVPSTRSPKNGREVAVVLWVDPWTYCADWTNGTFMGIANIAIDEVRPMTVARARRPTTRSAAKLGTHRERADIGKKLLAAFSASAAKLSPADRKRLIANRAQFIIEFAADPEGGPYTVKMVAKASAEVSQGAGLGKMLSPEEGGARIAAYATPTKIEDWAGPLAGPAQLERDFGVARSTLHNWQKQGMVIGLLVGVRKHAFPTEQFVDGRPVTGLSAIVEAIGDPRVAWLWLREPNPGLAGVTPLARLKAGKTGKVVDIARSNFADA